MNLHNRLETATILQPRETTTYNHNRFHPFNNRVSAHHAVTAQELPQSVQQTHPGMLRGPKT